MKFRIADADVRRERARAFGAILVAALLAFAISDGNAAGLSATDLMGRWCGNSIVYTFSPKRLVVTFSYSTQQSVLRIKSIEVHDDWLDVIWDPRDGVNTVFQEFSGDMMVQAPNTSGDRGPRREFHRC